MPYNHKSFQETWNTVPAVYPILLSQHEKCTNLVHITVKKLGRRRLKETQILSVINESLRELGITFEASHAFRVFAGTYHGIQGQIIKHGRHWRSEKTGPKQIMLPLKKGVVRVGS